MFEQLKRFNPTSINETQILFFLSALLTNIVMVKMQPIVLLLLAESTRTGNVCCFLFFFGIMTVSWTLDG